MNKINHFMVVDDNHTNNLICEFTIRKYSKYAEISLFTEPEVALEKIGKEYGKKNENKLTVLFLDINMPSLTGWDFLDVFGNFNEDIQRQFLIYILSSSVDHRDKEKAETHPFVSGFLSKPLTIQNIEQIFIHNNLILPVK
jgi:CheY-like chemotaxis protein